MYFGQNVILESESVSTNAVSTDSVSESASSNAVSQNFIEALGQIDSKEDLQQEMSIFKSMLADLPEKLVHFAAKFVIAVIAFIICTQLINLIRKLAGKWLRKSKAEEGVIQFADSLLKVILYFAVISGFAAYFGIETASLITILGSMTVAVALAVQGSFSNFIGGVLILILKPFKVGDYIIEDSHKNEGTVIEITMFYTKLRTVDDKIVIIPNGNLSNSSLTNLHLSPHRRVVLYVGISYNSDIKKAKQIIRECIDNDKYSIEGGLVDVFVDDLAESQVTLGFRYYVKNSDYFDSKWAILEEIKYKFDENGIEIPFNQLVVHNSKD